MEIVLCNFVSKNQRIACYTILLEETKCDSKTKVHIVLQSLILWSRMIFVSRSFSNRWKISIQRGFQLTCKTCKHSTHKLIFTWWHTLCLVHFSPAYYISTILMCESDTFSSILIKQLNIIGIWYWSYSFRE